ncbi:aldo/keto reductase [Microlunatus soli]|uniref:Predicted oxidoreductase of the aldo/keto reductase family n=1 Tax=Microlunatus soli TaxID=630515 RepID=A0A1H2A8E5_9ACTN|nr:aldo/keto reductase [Microlunatus soli]SDT42255.1 Predicted oxidoreductase of the aldo/keto reductase family [Microlunatus soli]
MIPTLDFGRTGHTSTRIIFGAAALSDVTQEEADRTLELVRRHGITHIDTAASYGAAEERLGPFIEQHRDDYFLASKTGDRTREDAYASIRRSLERMRTDHLDLIQLHNLVDEDERQTALGAGGALEACVQARDEGLVKHIGITGHGVTVAAQHLKSLQVFDFDSVLLPYNFPMTRNQAYIDDWEALYDYCQQHRIAVQTIKAITKAPWQDDKDHFAATWYEPLQDQQAIDTAVSWVLGRPGIFLNTVGDIHILPKVLDAAERFTARPDDDAMSDLERVWGMEPLFV